jgi:hypothetical protein
MIAPLRFLSHLIRDDAAAALAETALVAPLLLALMIGSVEVGRFADYAIKVTNAAHAALADGQSISGLTATAQTYCTCADGTADAGCIVATCSATHRIVYVRVDTSGTLASILSSPLIPAQLTSITVSRFAIMRVEE